MDIEQLREYALSKEGAIESFPFGETTLVFKVSNKIFMLLSLDDVPLRFNVKCDPGKALELRELNEAIIPGYHMNKKHWNTIIMDGSLSDKLIREMIDHSYELITTNRPATKAKA